MPHVLALSSTTCLLPLLHSTFLSRVFGPDSSQADVFGEVSLLIDNVLDGYNCCIIAYGQTGSGKTYTMEGVGDGDGAGVNTRALAELFRLVEERRERVGDVEVLGSMLEIYNEQLFDLLGQHKSNKGLDIKEVGLLVKNIF